MKDEKKKLATRNGVPVVDNQNTMTARGRMAQSSCRMSGILRN